MTGKKKASAGPIAHVVLIIKENHAFDNYFGTFPGANGAHLAHSSNPPPQDPDHSHGAWLTRQATAVRTQFVEADIPAYFAYARQFTLCDNYFTDVAGPSTPNHLMLIAAASPVIVNPPRSVGGGAVFKLPSLPLAAERANLSWRNYGGYAFDLIADLRGRPTLASAQFAKDAALGNPVWNGTQFRYGTRVGCLALSPYAKAGYISRALHSHVSLLRFCETTFGLPALNARDASADDMADCFDYSQRPAPPPFTAINA